LDSESLNLLLWLVLIVVVFFLGQIYGVYTLLSQITKEFDFSNTKNNQYPEMIVEKIDGKFYAYIGDMFVAQSDNVISLVDEIPKNPNVTDFVLASKFPTLTSDEHTLFLETMLNRLKENIK
jgi:hypothetical protein